MTKEQLLDIILDLPVDMRAKIADQILKSLNPPGPEVEKAWIKEVCRRKKQLEAGEVELIPGDQFDKEVQEMKKRFSE